jgi:hypothetical protein
LNLSRGRAEGRRRRSLNVPPYCYPSKRRDAKSLIVLGGRDRTRTCDLLRVKRSVGFFGFPVFYPVPLTFNNLGNLLFARSASPTPFADLQPIRVTILVVSIIFRFNPVSGRFPVGLCVPTTPLSAPKCRARESSAVGGIRTHAALEESASYRFIVAGSARSATTAVAHYPKLPKRTKPHARLTSPPWRGSCSTLL